MNKRSDNSGAEGGIEWQSKAETMPRRKDNTACQAGGNIMTNRTAQKARKRNGRDSRRALRSYLQHSRYDSAPCNIPLCAESFSDPFWSSS